MALNLYALENPEALIWLMTIKAPGFADTYIANNLEDVTSRGTDYIAWPFNLVLAIDDGEQLPQVRLTIDNVDNRIVETLRQVAEPPGIKLELVVASAPDAVEMVLDYMVLKNISYDVFSITGALQSTNILSRKFPARNYDPTQFPGLFY